MKIREVIEKNENGEREGEGNLSLECEVELGEEVGELLRIGERLRHGDIRLRQLLTPNHANLSATRGEIGASN